MPLIQVISGAKTGADLAGLKAARDFGILTGGTISRGFRTLDGPRPEYRDLFNLTEHESPDYPPRTRCNVLDSDGTVSFAMNWSSPGEKLTLKTIDKYSKPHFLVDMRHPRPLDEALDWLDSRHIQILNIAGNSEKTCKGMESCVYIYLVSVFIKLGFQQIHTSFPDLIPVQV